MNGAMVMETRPGTVSRAGLTVMATTGATASRFPRAVAAVTATPARCAGFDDRGEIAPGQFADLVRVSLVDDVPLVRGVWRRRLRVA